VGGGWLFASMMTLCIWLEGGSRYPVVIWDVQVNVFHARQLQLLHGRGVEDRGN